MTTTAKRQRQREGRLARMEAERKAAQRAARKRRIITGAIVGVLLIGVLALVAFVGGDDDEQADGPEATASEAPDPEKPDVTVPEAPATELQTTNLERGEGPRVREGDTVEVRYVGKAQSNGEEFDSNYDGEPFSFTIGQGDVIPGWDQGVPGMRPGGRRQLVIPGELAYGPEGRPPDIGPDDTLVFVIDLLSATPAEGAAPTSAAPTSEAPTTTAP